MAADTRIALITFLVAVLIHLAIVLGVSQFPWPVAPPPLSVRQSVVHLRRSVSTPAQVPAQAAPAPAPLAPPVLPMPMLQPQLPPPTPRVLSRPQPTHVAEAAPARTRRTIPRPQARQPQKPKTETRPPDLPKPLPVIPQSDPPVLHTQPVPDATAREQPAIAALPALPPVPAAAELELRRTYMDLVAETLKRHQHYPLSARRRGLSGQVVLQFTIHADGRITNPQIIDSRGHAVFRTASLRVLKRVGTMPPFPPDFRQRQLTVKIPMRYELAATR